MNPLPGGPQQRHQSPRQSWVLPGEQGVRRALRSPPGHGGHVLTQGGGHVVVNDRASAVMCQMSL